MISPKNIILYFCLLLPLAAIALHNNFLLQMWFLGVLVLVCLSLGDLFVTVRRCRGLEVSVPDNLHMFLERDSEITFTLTNPETATLKVCLRADLPELLNPVDLEKQMSLPEGTSLLKWLCCPEKRGDYSVSTVYAEVSTPLNLWTIRKEYTVPCSIKVYPNVQQERKRLAHFFASNAPGSHLQRALGQGREFEQLRDYVPGDSFGIISWKSTAKRAKPISKVYQVETTQEVYVVIDTSRSSGKQVGETNALENYILSALILGQVAEKQGDLFGVVAFDDQVRKFIRAKGGSSHYTTCRESLYTLQPQKKSQDFNALFTFLKTNLRRRSLIIFLTDLADSTVAESFKEHITVVSTKHLCAVNMVKDECVAPLFKEREVNEVDDIYSSLAGHMSWSTLMGVKQSLAKHGVSMNMVDHDQLSSQLVTSYLDIKRRQLI